MALPQCDCVSLDVDHSAFVQYLQETDFSVSNGPNSIAFLFLAALDLHCGNHRLPWGEFVRYLVLASDFDGTLAHHGRVDEATLAAVERLLESGRKLILVTGRELNELQSIFPQLDLCEWVVAENGALLYKPGTRETRLLCEPPPERFIAEVRRRGVGPVSVGKAIVATWRPHENAVLNIIRELGLELQVIFNKDAVMVLPASVNKATGLAAALRELGLSRHNAIGIGDAENDHAFLALCECAVAVDNALPALKERADIVTRGDHGRGVTELIDELIRTDLSDRDDQLTRHHLLLGTGTGGAKVELPVYGTNLLIAGPSGSGKSTIATSLLERLTGHGYQFCIIDPEGDYDTYEGAVPLGTPQRAPSLDEVLRLLEQPDQNVVVNLVGLSLGDRPPYFLTLMPRLQEMRSRTGRPHWLVIDETHHLLPSSWQPGTLSLPKALNQVVCITVHPNLLAAPVLAALDTVIAVGPAPEKTLHEFCAAVGEPTPDGVPPELKSGEVCIWRRRTGERPMRVAVAPSRSERRRHSRKYAAGELPPEQSFYFRGPEGKLNLRAQNLILFLQLAEGVDDATWLHHLHNSDYARWFRDMIKDEALADMAVAVAGEASLSAAESRKRIRVAIEQNYTLPAGPPLPMPGTTAAPKRQELPE